MILISFSGLLILVAGSALLGAAAAIYVSRRIRNRKQGTAP